MLHAYTRAFRTQRGSPFYYQNFYSKKGTYTPTQNEGQPVVLLFLRRRPVVSIYTHKILLPQPRDPAAAKRH